MTNAAYRQCMVLAKAKGFSNVQIAHAAGVTEAAVRMWLKRRSDG